jgi:methionyl-tRNA formyltransferase
MKIVFMGTPDFAVPCLKILLQNGFEIVAVVTAPDKPAGRGLKLTTTPVKEFAVQHNLKVLQPEKLRDENFLNELKALQPDLSIVVAFRMLPEIVWSLPKYGSINLHASILPKYRGAAPINWAIMNGEKETGVSTFFIQKQIDTGNIIYSEKVAITPTDTAGILHDKLMKVGSRLILKTVLAVQENNYPQIPQDLSVEQPLAPKIFKDDCKINFNQPAEKLYNFIRGLSPYPAAWATADGKILKIFFAELTDETSNNKPVGTIITDSKSYIKVAAQDFLLNITELQIEGKKKMKTEEFLRGNKFQQLLLN